MNAYKHLTKEERHLIYLLWNKEKYSMNKISKILNKRVEEKYIFNWNLLFTICS